jgi:hypothetical protein
MIFHITQHHLRTEEAFSLFPSKGRKEKEPSPCQEAEEEEES